MEQQQIQKPAPPASNDAEERVFQGVQRAAVERRKRLAGINVEKILSEDPEDFVKRMQQTTGE